jgi:pyruvate/2-oxoglutarate dehydrogenase complex dihydrolipoamide acyltransferase (E2) component
MQGFHILFIRKENKTMKNTKKINFSKNRRTISAYMKIAHSIPFGHMTTEIRVPGLKAFCFKHGVTYTIVIMKTIAGVKAKYPIMNSIFAYDFTLRKKIYLCDNVDMALAIEKHENDEYFATFAAIKNVNKKTIYELSTEVKYLKDLPMIKMPYGVLFLMLNYMPDLLKILILKIICKIPSLNNAFFGSVGLSTLGKYGLSSFDTLFVNNFGYAISKIEDKQIVKNGKAHVEPVLHLTQTYNHCVADGALSARVLAEVKHIFESGEYMSICEPEVSSIDHCSSPFLLGVENTRQVLLKN